MTRDELLWRALARTVGEASCQPGELSKFWGFSEDFFAEDRVSERRAIEEARMRLASLTAILEERGL
tara:strand:- start:260 stop:460 length:201 start_codon:yes stop_codon:yes gene_type:complete